MTRRLTPADYDTVATAYDRRYSYAAGERRGVAAALMALADEVGATRILEAGCGTGHWLKVLDASHRHVCGLDSSAGMLHRARSSGARTLARGTADALPFASDSFELVFCVSAVHHFADPEAFIHAARRLLRPGGAIGVVGLDPHSGHDRWYLYDYFRGTLETDRRRYPSSGALTDWMIAAGCERVTRRVADRIRDPRVGRNVFGDPMLGRKSTSVLTPLTDEQYAAGLARIESAVAQAEASGAGITFPVDLSLAMVTGYLP